ncbi:MAG: hypothetical protein U9R50_06375 [Campylobacterota bacterium]|nr:hypothetical protein [Campylobacterota bacterium]
MELKDVILSTLAEMDSTTQEDDKAPNTVEQDPATTNYDKKETLEPIATIDEEQRYLEGIRERLLVLFEGFQSPNNTQIEAKVDLTLNFLEYLLATIDTRLEKIK